MSGGKLTNEISVPIDARRVNDVGDQFAHNVWIAENKGEDKPKPASPLMICLPKLLDAAGRVAINTGITRESPRLPFYQNQKP